MIRYFSFVIFRNFSYNTSRKKVYKLVGQYDAKQEEDTDESNDVDIEKMCTMRYSIFRLFNILIKKYTHLHRSKSGENAYQKQPR